MFVELNSITPSVTLAGRIASLSDIQLIPMIEHLLCIFSILSSTMFPSPLYTFCRKRLCSIHLSIICVQQCLVHSRCSMTVFLFNELQEVDLRENKDASLKQLFLSQSYNLCLGIQSLDWQNRSSILRKLGLSP